MSSTLFFLNAEGVEAFEKLRQVLGHRATCPPANHFKFMVQDESNTLYVGDRWVAELNRVAEQYCKKQHCSPSDLKRPEVLYPLGGEPRLRYRTRQTEMEAGFHGLTARLMSTMSSNQPHQVMTVRHPQGEVLWHKPQVVHVLARIYASEPEDLAAHLRSTLNYTYANNFPETYTVIRRWILALADLPSVAQEDRDRIKTTVEEISKE